MQLRSEAALTPPPPSIGAALPLPHREQTIVVVDDMRANRLLLVAMLRQLDRGLAIKSFASPADALQFVAETRSIWS
jgi:hypothetical protein